MTRTPDPGEIAYKPIDPTSSRRIGLIGCGWISEVHLEAYRKAGYDVAALCDRNPDKARARKEQFFPDATTYSDHADLIARDDIDVVDIVTHVDYRPDLVEETLRAGKHVLSQKPLVEDLDEGERLCDLADELRLVLAVNHNGRWAPHFAYLLSAAREGLLGTVSAADFAAYWPHDAIVKDMKFATMEDLILYDFGIHWFDLLATLFAEQGRAPVNVFAGVGSQPHQLISVPTQAQAVVDFDDAQASILFRGSSPIAELGSYRVTGSHAVLTHAGGYLGGDEVTVTTTDESQTVSLVGSWFPDGMHGAMSEVLCALDTDRPPRNSARSALAGLALCFAAIESTRIGTPVRPGTVRRLSGM